MAHFLIQVTYTPEAWASMMHNPQSRRDAIQPVIENLGGSITGSWFALGEYDGVALLELPDNVSAAAFSLACSASGALKSFKTTPLITNEEAMDAMGKANASGYRPPSE
ncbi:GYD domain-containing protein [Pseudomaricurvus alkylphenolicus]|jgi:uncharacterized protein with GYD domain|uniref:GYD domain-containing protein n=1 Tax=Pseudomaricurvus alkylphenolicus TaxID=1306991 RepID=UPI0014204337|nr:GYD domain-containing protein [Pseudomaricurvus alkylphenolicus]NIB41551.1 GYD domain-containing protein [Pseudomaricurvus alkylphenolicus]